jgi:hypothetical protein
MERKRAALKRIEKGKGEKNMRTHDKGGNFNL